MAEAAPDIEAELADLAAACQHDPLAWAQAAWDWGRGALAGVEGPRAWQAEMLAAIRDHLQNPETRHQPCQIAIASGHGVGKSAGMGMISNWAMSCFDDARVLTTANTETQLRTKTVPEVSKWFRSSITAHWFDVQATAIKARDAAHAASWRADFVPWSEHNTEAFAGLHNKGRIIVLLFDEASKIHNSVWEVAEGALTDEDTIIIWVVFGNPTQATGRFRECFRALRHRWITRQIDSRSVPGTNKVQIAKWVEDYGEESDFVKVRVRGIFPSMSARQFISEADVEAAFGRALRPEQYGWAPRIITCDPAWEGDDELVIGLRQGLMFRLLATLPKNDNDVAVANRLARLEDEHDADAVFIDGGYGTGIVSVGRTLGRAWQLVWFSGASADPGCLNKRAEMWKLGRDWLKEGGAIPPDLVLRDDLIGPETVPRLDGKLQLEPKDAMKRRGLPSPNRADALMLSFAYPVMAKTALLGAGRPDMTTHDFDPFERGD